MINVLRHEKTIEKWAKLCCKSKSNLDLTLIKVLIGKIKFEKRCLINSLPANLLEVKVVLENIDNFKKDKKKKGDYS